MHRATGTAFAVALRSEFVPILNVIDCRLEREIAMADGCRSNGLAFSPCGRWLYHSDTARRTIFRFAITPEGLEDKQPCIRSEEADGYPDGMTSDADGYLWVAHWDGACISRFAPDGRLDRAIALPARRVTSITFAGEALDHMFVTSAATGLPPSEYDGALFEVQSGATGVPTGQYAG